MISPNHLAMLSRMENASRDTQNHLRLVERRIAARAERMAVTFRARSRPLGRSSTTWTNADERRYQDNVSALAFARQAEIDALMRKLARRASGTGSASILTGAPGSADAAGPWP